MSVRMGTSVHKSMTTTSTEEETPTPTSTPGNWKCSNNRLQQGLASRVLGPALPENRLHLQGARGKQRVPEAF